MLRRIRYVFFCIAAVAVLAIVSGVIYEQWSRRDVVDRHPPPGRMVEVDGHKLHLNCTGSGSPTIVLEAGAGTNGSLHFAQVQPEIAKSHRVCSYDRAGMMWSERRDGTRSAMRTVDDLHSLLEIATEPPPYVMVGYSMGGLFIRVFAERYPQEVVGMLFVEPSHPEQSERGASIEGNDPYEYSQWTHLKLRVQVETGVARLFGILDDPDPSITAMIVNDFTPYGVVTYLEQELARQDLDAEAAAASAFDDMPIIVLTGELQIIPATPEEAADMSPDEVRIWNEWADLWYQLHAEIAELSTNSEHRVIDGSGHSMSREVPDAVIRGVHDVVTMCCGDE